MLRKLKFQFGVRAINGVLYLCCVTFRKVLKITTFGRNAFAVSRASCKRNKAESSKKNVKRLNNNGDIHSSNRFR